VLVIIRLELIHRLDTCPYRQNGTASPPNFLRGTHGMRSIMQLVRWTCGAISRLSLFTYDAPLSHGKDESSTAEATPPAPDLVLDGAVETKRRAVDRCTLWPGR
jgi:hypothetical protein